MKRPVCLSNQYRLSLTLTLTFTFFSMFCYRKKTEDLLVAIEDDGLKADVKTKHSRTRI